MLCMYDKKFLSKTTKGSKPVNKSDGTSSARWITGHKLTNKMHHPKSYQELYAKARDGFIRSMATDTKAFDPCSILSICLSIFRGIHEFTLNMLWIIKFTLNVVIVNFQTYIS